MHALGYRYRLSNGDLPGSPDMANRTRRWALFVHGCYWHHHHGCSRATIPKTNTAWWVEKFRQNKARDARANRRLKKLGYRVVVVWECDTESAARLRRLLSTALR